MPTVLRVASYRFHFYSDEGREPPHNIATSDGECKFWLDPVRLASNRGLSPMNGFVLRWENLDEDITVPGIVAGNFQLPYVVKDSSL